MDRTPVPLTTEDLRAVTTYAVECAVEALPLFAAGRPDDRRPADALAAARQFAEGGTRAQRLRDTAFAAQKAAADAATPAGREAARAAMAAAGSAFLHPFADARQVGHILGAAAHTAVAHELAEGDPQVGERYADRLAGRATAAVLDVLGRYPAAPDRGGRVGELTRRLDRLLRG